MGRKLMEYHHFNMSKFYFLFISLIFSNAVFSNTVEDALKAEQNNQDQEATEIWSRLASKGNTIAKYNLATHYSNGNGVAKDVTQAKKWLKEATHSSLAQAYTTLNKKALTSANGLQLTFKSGPLYWLEEQDPNLYTIQLASSRYEKSILKIYEDNFLNGKGGYYHYIRDGVDRYSLIYGTYKTVAEAKTAIDDLPQGLRKKTPWVRNIKSIQKISEND
ncbi:MAG: SPOR domain-containing protein [Gammaproteobacteria bacterium]|nr:SPOR domain-containing protein [Gammaproteobacteria bacterium]